MELHTISTAARG